MADIWKREDRGASHFRKKHFFYSLRSQVHSKASQVIAIACDIALQMQNTDAPEYHGPREGDAFRGLLSICLIKFILNSSFWGKVRKLFDLIQNYLRLAFVLFNLAADIHVTASLTCITLFNQPLQRSHFISFGIRYPQI